MTPGSEGRSNAAAKAPALTTDFDRQVYLLMGLPVDALTETQALYSLRQSIVTGTRCFLSTPNLNFVVNAMRDPHFRDSVIDSDLVLADGMSLIWAARLLGVPLPERLAGSSLLSQLPEPAPRRRSIKVYFFGGAPGVAQRACHALAARAPGLTGAGWHTPGFVNAWEASDDAVLSAINAEQPDVVLVSLGAQKGQAWIQLNRQKLEAPVICHLGAAMNFIAGTITRAPMWMQRTGLEWVWRILQEPPLVKRYWLDGWSFAAKLPTHLLPLFCHYLASRWVKAASDPLRLEVAQLGDKGIQASVVGAAIQPDLKAVRDIFKRLCDLRSQTIKIDLKHCIDVDACFLGLLALLLKHQRSVGHQLLVCDPSPKVKRLFRLHSAEYLLTSS